MDNNNPQGFFDRFIEFGKKIFNRFSKIFDRIIFNQRGSALISLILAIVLCVSIDYDTISIQLFNDMTTSVTLSDIKVTTLADTDSFEILGVPDTVEVTLTGSSTDIQVFRQQQDLVVTCDLRKYGDGENEVNLTMNPLPSNLSAKINPDTLNVTLNKKVKKSFHVTPELLIGNGQKMSDFESPILEDSFVDIIASQDTLDSIRVVKAIVDATGQFSDFEYDAKLVAYDAEGNVIFVTVEPATIRAEVKLAQKEE